VSQHVRNVVVPSAVPHHDKGHYCIWSGTFKSSRVYRNVTHDMANVMSRFVFMWFSWVKYWAFSTLPVKKDTTKLQNTTTSTPNTQYGKAYHNQGYFTKQLTSMNSIMILALTQGQGQGYITTNNQSVSMSWYRAQSWTIDLSLLSPWNLI
jgi:hypothetical protein